jgi:hypothetical protein
VQRDGGQHALLALLNAAAQVEFESKGLKPGFHFIELKG